MAPTSGQLENDEESNQQVLLQSFAMIIFSEIGDRSFLITAILAMRQSRVLVFGGAFASSIVMSFLSAEMGHFLPTLIPRSWTQMAASILFFFFGGKMLFEAWQMEGGNAKIQEEMREAESEIADDDALHDRLPSATLHERDIPLDDMEHGGDVVNQILVQPSQDVRTSWKSWISDGARNFCSLFFGPVLVQAFALTFLGEWGDRSQIATLAFGAAHNVYLVTLGTVVGHGCCIALAVIGGGYLSTKISIKHVTLGGSLLFLSFGFIYLYEAIARSPSVELSIPISPEILTTAYTTSVITMR